MRNGRILFSHFWSHFQQSRGTGCKVTKLRWSRLLQEGGIARGHDAWIRSSSAQWKKLLVMRTSKYLLSFEHSQLRAFSASSILSFERSQLQAFSASRVLSFERSQLRASSAWSTLSFKRYELPVFSASSVLSFERSQLRTLSALSALSIKRSAKIKFEKRLNSCEKMSKICEITMSADAFTT